MSAGVSVTFGGADLVSSEITSISRSDELLWSESTGRSAESGLMVGSVVAEKQTYSVAWGVLTASQYSTLRSRLVGGFKTLAISVGGAQLASISAYRGTVSGELLGVFGGTAYYKGVSVELVEV